VNGEKVATAIDSLGAQKAQGFIICAPDVKLGQGIVAKAKQYNLKLMTVDDRLVDGKNNPIEAVPHMGISAYEIGKQVGKALAEEMKKRNLNMSEVGAIRVTSQGEYHRRAAGQNGHRERLQCCKYRVDKKSKVSQVDCLWLE